MKTAKKTTKLFATLITLSIAETIWFARGVQHARAIHDSEDFPSPVGISFGHTARLSRTSVRRSLPRARAQYPDWSKEDL
jgi:hypothetical protein